MDVHVPYPVTSALLAQKVDVLTAQWDGTTRWTDPALLDRATALARVLVSQDEDLLVEASRRQRNREHFAGLIYAHQQKITLGNLIEDLMLLAQVCAPDEIADRVEFLPL